MKLNFFSILPKVLSALAVLCLATSRPATATQANYINNGNLQAPPLAVPQIDATNFVNNATFAVNNGYFFTAGGVTVFTLVSDPFEFSNTENYTNRSIISGTPGFRFDTAPAVAPANGIVARHRAKSFVNGTLTTPVFFSNSIVAGSTYVIINASNVVNRGVLSVGSAGEVHIEGSKLDLARGYLKTGEMGIQEGMRADFWGNANAARAIIIPAQQFNSNAPSGGRFHATNAATAYTPFLTFDSVWGARGFGGEIFAKQFVNTRKITSTNAQVSVEGVFVRVSDTNNATVTIVGEPKAPGDPTTGVIGVELAVTATNAFGLLVTNFLSVIDEMGSFRTNTFKKWTGSYNGLIYRPTYLTTNYTVLRTPLASIFPFFNPASGTPIQRYLDDTNYVPFFVTNTVVLGTNNLAITNVIVVFTNIIGQAISGNTNFFVGTQVFFGTNGAGRTNVLAPATRNFNVTSFYTINGTNQSVTIRDDVDIVSDGDVSFFITNTFSRQGEFTNTVVKISPYFNITNVFAGTNIVVSNFVSTTAGLTLGNTTYIPNPPATISNLPGRVEISADQALSLNFTRISSVNYVKIESPNQFNGSSNAIISTPYCDIRLASTNGRLTVSNLLSSAPPVLVGTVDLYSVFWTNQVLNIPSLNTNPTPVETHVLLVDLQLSISTNSQILSFDLKASNGGNTGTGTGTGAGGSGIPGGTGGGTYIGCFGNPNPTTITIDDAYFTTNSFTADADNFRIGVNGVLSLDIPSFTWTAELPYVHTFTNNGIIGSEANILGFQLYSHYCDDSPRPYDSVVNYGLILPGGSFETSALDFQNYGLIASYLGAVSIVSSNLILGDLGDGSGEIDSSLADVTLAASHFAATNHLVVSDRALNLWITNSLEDGGNTFLTEDGCNLFQKPATGDFNASLFVSIGYDYAEVYHTWAGVDFGPVDTGYTDNAAMGNLDLEGGVFTRFIFSPATSNNALYVDRLDLNGTAGDFDADGNLGNIEIQPGMNIYYANVYINGVPADLTGKFGAGGASGGGFTPVAHSGIFTRPSSGGSIIKALTHGKGMDVKVAYVHGSTSKATVSWNTVAGAANTIYYKNSIADATWHVLKTFASQRGGRTAVSDTVGNTTRFYKVELNLANP